MRQAILIKEFVMQYKYLKLKNKRVIFKRFLIKSLFPLSSVFLCPCLLGSLSLFSKTSVVV